MVRAGTVVGSAYVAQSPLRVDLWTRHLGVVIVALSTKQQPLRRVAAWFATSVCAFILMSAYIILPNGSTTLPTQVGSVSLNIYRTNGDPHLGLFANVAASTAFGEPDPVPNFPRTSLLDGRSLCRDSRHSWSRGLARPAEESDEGRKYGLRDGCRATAGDGSTSGPVDDFGPR